MANQFPEVLPQVQSMPTTGWFCQTSGNARKRVTANTSMSDSQGVYDVKGVPGHSHNASAVVSVDADYSRYRDTSINVPANVWSYGAYQLPQGILTDSEEPDNQAERYDRAIEKCVGYMSLFPENCTGHIREPTRSIGEIRTLVAPKARLETLTYIDEMGGWRIPVGADDDEKEQEVLVSEFPDVRVSVLPRSQIQAATIAADVSPGSLYIDFDSALNQRYRVEATAEGIVGHVAGAAYGQWFQYAQARAAGGAGAVGLTAEEEARLEKLARWDNCIVFSWDTDQRKYRSRKEVTVVLNNVVAVHKATVGVAPAPQAGAAAGPIFDGAAADNHYPKLTVTFPLLETTPAFDGSCWFASISNEEAINYAKRDNGLTLAKSFQVDILGAGTVGPFQWVGMPAWRIPVGGKYALPGPDILQELFGNGVAWGAADDAAEDTADVQYNFYDQFFSLGWEGILQYHHRQQSAEIVHQAVIDGGVANGTPDTISKRAVVDDGAGGLRSLTVWEFATRALHKNGGLFRPRPGGFQKHLYDKQLLRDFTAVLNPFIDIENPQTADIITSGIRNVLYDFRTPAQVNATATAERDATAAAITANSANIQALVTVNGENMVNGNRDLVARNKVQIERLRLENAALSTRLISEEALVLIAGAQAAATHIDPLRRDSSACFKISFATGTNFTGTCTFDFPIARFPAGDAQRFWQAGPPATTQAASHNFVAVACTPLMFLADGDGANEGRIPAAAVAGPLAKTLTTCPTCIMDVTQVAGSLVTCAYDFTDTVRFEQGYNSTAAALGSKFFVGGYSFYLSRLEADASNMIATYMQHAHITADGTSQDARDRYADIFRIGNMFSVATAQLSWMHQAGNVVQFILKDYLFATDKVKGVFFRSTTAHEGRVHLFYAPIEERSAQVVYTTGGGGAYATGRSRIFTGRPYMYSRGVLADIPRALMQALGAANIAYDMVILDEEFCEQNKTFTSAVGPFEEEVALTRSLGAVFQSNKRISQHVCGPILNPNMRIGAVAPLNYDSRHLPPEMRDFRLQFYDIDWSRLQASKTTLNELTLYQFRDGNQKVGAEMNVLYLPQFREFKYPITDGTFEVEVFSELGAPSYFCFFCRGTRTDILQQPIIRTLSIYNATTKKKSNVVQDLSVSQLFHLTQRNVHPQAQYDKDAFRRRQTVLLSTEDIGMLGLTPDQYQKAKRVNYVFSGTTDSILGNLYVVLVYNNRGLHIDGRRLQVVTLHE